MHQDATWYAASLSPGDFVLDGDPAPPPKKGGGARGGGAPPQFSAHFYCGQTAGCINMPFDMDIGLSPGDIVLDGDPVRPPQKGNGAPKFLSPCLLWPNS